MHVSLWFIHMSCIGTAGHIDHGKSALVKVLTGIDPDRLAEEKARGMTIDLGFAWLTLPGGREVSIVDVPGHEGFIKNMLAGVGGIDAALLVIAADEGVMPQTREHLAILDLLRVLHGVEVLPAGIRTRIRALQTHQHNVEIAYPGSRVALNLSNVPRADLQRGDVVSLPGQFQQTMLIDVRLSTLREAALPLAHNAQVDF